MTMYDLFLLSGILFFASQILYLAIAAWRDISNMRINRRAVENQEGILTTYEWVSQWIKSANDRFAYLSDSVHKLQNKEEKEPQQ